MRSLRSLALIALLVPVGCKRPTPPAESVTLGVLTELQGITEPCGCSTRPLGGMDKVAQHLETLAAAGTFGFIIAGNTSVTYATPKDQEAAQEGAKAAVIAEILQRLHPLYTSLGPWDDNPVAHQAWAALPEATRTNLAWPPRLGSQLRTVAGMPMGFLSSGGEFSPQHAAALNTEAADLRAAGARVVILVGSGGMPAARAIAPFLAGVDAIITGGGDPPLAPEQVGQTWLFDGGSKGQTLGLLNIHPKGSGPWHLFDGGKAARAALNERRARWLNEAAALPEGPARQAREARAAALAQEANAMQVEEPAGPYFGWSLTYIDKQVPAAPWATQKLAAYNRSLCETSRAATANRVCPTADDGLAYVGNPTCKACHAGAFAIYDKSQHARAWATLTSVGKDCDLGCIGCHTLGYEKPNGFCRLDDAPKFANVNCENCHGPASAHVAHPQDRKAWGARFVPHPGAETCRACHTHEHSDQFNFSTYVVKITGEGHRLSH